MLAARAAPAENQEAVSAWDRRVWDRRVEGARVRVVATHCKPAPPPPLQVEPLASALAREVRRREPKPALLPLCLLRGGEHVRIRR